MSCVQCGNSDQTFGCTEEAEWEFGTVRSYEMQLWKRDGCGESRETGE